MPTPAFSTMSHTRSMLPVMPGQPADGRPSSRRPSLPLAAGLPTYRGCAGRSSPMIYILAFFVPPLALLLNGQPFSAVLNLVLIVPCILFGLVFPILFLV